MRLPASVRLGPAVCLFLTASAAFCTTPTAGATGLTRTEVVCTSQVEDNYSPALTTAVRDTAVTGAVKMLSCTESVIDVASGSTLSAVTRSGTPDHPVAVGTLTNLVLSRGTCTSLPTDPPGLSGTVEYVWNDAPGGTSTLVVDHPLVSTVNGAIVFAATTDTLSTASTRYAGYKVVAAGLGNPVHEGSCLPGDAGVTKVTGSVQFTFSSP